MPVAAAIAPLAGAAIGAISGASNPRPPSLTPQQNTALNASLASNSATANAPASIDPVQQALMYGQNARNTVAANNATTNALASRGLGSSGILASGIQQNEDTNQVNNSNTDLALQQQSIQQKDFANQMIASLTKVSDIPGQSTLGAATAGAAGPLTAAIGNASNFSNPGSSFNYWAANNANPTVPSFTPQTATAPTIADPTFSSNPGDFS